MPGKKFKLNQAVAWTSQAGGYSKRKTGKIIEVVPAGKMPTKHTHLDTVTTRSHESYVVLSGKQRIYWPRVSHLY